MNVRNMLRSPEFAELLNRSVIEAMGPIMLPVVEKVQVIEKRVHERTTQFEFGALKREDLGETDQQIRQLIASVLEEQLYQFTKTLHEQQEAVRALNEQLESLVVLHTRLAIEKLLAEDEFKAAISEQIKAQTARSVNSMLQERLKATSGLDLDETFLNNSIRAQIQSLIRDKNLDKNSKPDYASELNNAIVLDASSTYTGKRVVSLLRFTAGGGMQFQ